MFSKIFGGPTKDSNTSTKLDPAKKAQALAAVGIDPSLFEEPEMPDMEGEGETEGMETTDKLL